MFLNLFIPEILKWTLPSLNLDMSIASNQGFSGPKLFAQVSVRLKGLFIRTPQLLTIFVLKFERPFYYC